MAGIRTFTLLGLTGGLAAHLGELISPILTFGLFIAACFGLAAASWREPRSRDATSFVAALITLALGVLAGAGHPQLAIATAAVVTLILATREQSHRFIDHLAKQDVHAFARYAVIALAVLPFLPNRSLGPLGAWNPFQLWLVVVLVTGFSFAGYIANRTIGARRGVLATAIIGGAYSSTAVTASLSQRLRQGEAGPLGAGIILASAIMYCRVILLVAALASSALPQFLLIVGPAAAVGAVAALLTWLRAKASEAVHPVVPGNPIELLPAFAFVAIVAVAALATRWAQLNWGQSGVAMSLFLTGSFDVDAAIVTLSGLPMEAIDRRTAAIALGGTIVANMMLKTLIVALYAGRRGQDAMIALGASTAVLVGTISLRLAAG